MHCANSLRGLLGRGGWQRARSRHRCRILPISESDAARPRATASSLGPTREPAVAAVGGATPLPREVPSILTAGGPTVSARGAFTKNEYGVDASSSAGAERDRFGPQTPGQTHFTLAARGLSSRAPTLGRIAPATTRPATHPHLRCREHPDLAERTGPTAHAVLAERRNPRTSWGQPSDGSPAGRDDYKDAGNTPGEHIGNCFRWTRAKDACLQVVSQWAVLGSNQ